MEPDRWVWSPELAGTPFDGKRIDLTHLKKASRMVGLARSRKRDYHVVVVMSTVVPGTTENVGL